MVAPTSVPATIKYLHFQYIHSYKSSPLVIRNRVTDTRRHPLNHSVSPSYLRSCRPVDKYVIGASRARGEVKGALCACADVIVQSATAQALTAVLHPAS